MPPENSFQSAVWNAITGFIRIGSIGRYESNGNTTIEVPGRPHYVYVRVGSAKVNGEVIEAYNGGAPKKKNAPVLIVRWNRNWRVIGIDNDSPGVDDYTYNVSYHEHSRESGLIQSVHKLDGMPSVLSGQAGKILTVADTEETYYLTDPPTGGGGFTEEEIKDFVSDMFIEGNGIEISVDDPDDEIIIGLTTLTSDWDIGEDRAILLELLKARDTEGIRFLTSSDAYGLIIDNDGDVAIGSSSATYRFQVRGTIDKSTDDTATYLVGIRSNDDSNPNQLSFLLYSSATASLRGAAIQSQELGVDETNLFLQPQGGNLIIGQKAYNLGSEALVHIYRNEDSSITNSPVFFIEQDHASDDQVALIVQQDGSGDILSLLDGTIEVFDVRNGGMVSISQIGVTGNALNVIRDLAAASTDSPLVSFVQDNTGDDQPVLYLRQDGTGDIVSIFDGATEVFDIQDGGRVGILQLATTGSALTVVRSLTSSSTNSPVVSILQDHASDDQAALLVTQDGVSTAAAIRMIHNASSGNAEGFTALAPNAVAISLELGQSQTAGHSFNVAWDETNGQAIIYTRSFAAPLVFTGEFVEITQTVLGDMVLRISTQATNDDVENETYQQRITTSGAGSTTYATIPIPTNYAAFIDYQVVARRTGGSAGAANDCGAGFGYVHAFNNGGTVTVQSHLGGPTFSWRGTAGPAINATNSGGNVILTVAGNANTNIVWHVTYTVRLVST